MAREVALSELLFTDGLVLMSETIRILCNNILKWREASESKCLKGNLGNGGGGVVVVVSTLSRA